MAEAAPQTEGNEARRRAMLQAAAALISERGFGETRIADVAKRAGTSSGLVIYYFGTRDRLLVDALRYSEEAFYDAATSLLDSRWRALVERVVREGQGSGDVGDVDTRRFAITFSVLLDGLATQVALG